MQLLQPTTPEEVERLAREHGVNTTAWIKGPEVLAKEVRDGDVQLTRGIFGLTAIRSAVLVSVYHITARLEWYEMYESHQEIRRPSGSYIWVARNLPCLRETWRFHRGEDATAAVRRCLEREAGLKSIKLSELKEVPESEVIDPPERSTFHKGFWTQRRRKKFEYWVPEEDFNPLGNVEYDEESGTIAHFPYRLKIDSP